MRRMNGVNQLMRVDRFIVLIIFCLLNSASRAQATVYLVPDGDHASSAARNQGLQMLQQLGGTKACLFLEVPTTYNAAFAAYASGRVSYDRSVGQMNARYQHAIRHVFYNIVPEFLLAGAAQQSARAYGMDFALGSPMQKRFKAAFDQVAPYLMDMSRAPAPALQNYAQVIEERSAMMAANVARLSRSACPNSVLIVGVGHLQSAIGPYPVLPLSEQLARRGIQAQ